MQSIHKQIGSSAVEIFISMLIFVPFFIGIPLLGKYADIQHKTLEASRYTVWERTVHGENNSDWNDGNTALKSSTQIFSEAERRFFGNQKVGMHQALGAEDLTENHFWKTRKGEGFLKGIGSNSDRKLAGSIALSDVVNKLNGAASINNIRINMLANRGLSQQVGGIANLNVDLGMVVDGCAAPGVNLGSGLDLGRRGFATSTVSVPVFDFMQRTEGDQKDMLYQEGAAILSNSWAAPDTGKYEERVSNLAPEDFVNCLTGVGDFYYGLPVLNLLFGEVKHSYRIDVDDLENTLDRDLYSDQELDDYNGGN